MHCALNSALVVYSVKSISLVGIFRTEKHTLLITLFDVSLAFVSFSKINQIGFSLYIDNKTPQNSQQSMFNVLINDWVSILFAGYMYRSCMLHICFVRSTKRLNHIQTFVILANQIDIAHYKNNNNKQKLKFEKGTQVLFFEF